MRVRKGSPADKLGIQFTGNPDARHHLEQESRKRWQKETPNPIDNPGQCLVVPLSK